MGTQIEQYDHVFPGVWIGFKREDDAAVVLYRTGPQSLELAAQLVRL